MSKRAGRVGVANDQVDVFGRLKFTAKQISYILSEFFKWAEFKVWKGGTEQLLPVNTSTPTTTSMIADIKYPDQKRTNQNILYRESPTTEDGTATLEKVVGHSVSFNQLVQNGNFADTSNWTYNSSQVTASVANNEMTFTSASAYYGILHSLDLVLNHKYYIKLSIKSTGNAYATIYSSTLASNIFEQDNPSLNQYNDIRGFAICSVTEPDWRLIINPKVSDITVNVKNVQLFDLTLMGIDSLTTVAQVEEWLATNIGSLPYYDFTEGKLISFTGTGLKTTRKNVLPMVLSDIKTVNTEGTWNGNTYSHYGIDYTFNVDEDDNILSIKINGTSTGFSQISLTSAGETRHPMTWYGLKYGESYIYTGKNSEQGNITLILNGSRNITVTASGTTFTVDDEEYYPQMRVYEGNTVDNQYIYPMIRLASISDDTFEPYTTNTLSLPIATYFPTGMKSAGSVADEMTQAKAITKIGSVDLGSLEWEYVSTGATRFISSGIKSLVKKPATISSVANIKCAKYNVGSAERVYQGLASIAIQAQTESSAGEIWICDSAYTDTAAFKTAMSGVMLYYELDTPTEEPIIELD